MIGQALKVFNDLIGWLMKWTQNVVAMVIQYGNYGNVFWLLW